MHKHFKLFNKLAGGLVAIGLTGTTAAEAFAQSKIPAAPPAISYPKYSFFQGLIFAPFPGTIPRPVVNGVVSSSLPLVQVPTPGLIVVKQPGALVVRRKKRLITPATEQPVRRRRRVILNNR